MSKPNVLVIGMGGVGTVAALTLEKNGAVEVSVIIRNQDEEFQKEGFTVDSVVFGDIKYKPQSIFKSIEEAASSGKLFDYIVVCTKNLPDSNHPVVKLIQPVVSDQSTIILTQNGLDIEVPILEKFPNNLVISGIELVGSSKYGNTVTQVSVDEVHLGIFKKNNIPMDIAKDKLMTYIKAYERDDNVVVIDEDVELNRWYKLCYNAVFNTTCAILDSDVSRVHIARGNKIFNKILNEIVKIADSEGYKLEKDRVDYIFHKSDGLFYHPSMQIDKEKNQLMEIEVIVGNPLRIAEKNGIETPYLSMVYDLLKVLQFRIKEKLGHFNINESDFRYVRPDDAPEYFLQQY
ncbi:uncharacterized protein CLIB1444_04S06700 [[Candida] jaroonii]|uniref:Uncharacterized protein n=1 Tax=[Candida] jaroonii TaxID=467808 RepID=A0ACA9Y7P8_9ASCO|nr:uncharacterized protein CLIB1444_04S06700 [[Candida] jaroonii]